MDSWMKKLTLDVYRCLICGHLWHHTQPDQKSLFEMYENGKPLNPKREVPAPSRRMQKQMQALFQLLRLKGIREPSLLDYGSGGGRWSKAAVMAGFHVTAYEPISRRSETESGSTNLAVIQNLENLGEIHFDVIMLEQVLEHVQKPVELLRSLRDYCHSSSVLRVSVPNLHIARIRGKDWAGFPFNGKSIHIMSPFEHLHGFTPRSLSIALKTAGLVLLNDWQLWVSHPIFSVRRFAGSILPFAAQTRAYAVFS